MTLLIDAMILAMLAGVLAYAWMVDRRVRFLMETLRELQPMISAYAAAVDKSEESVRDLASATRSLTEAPAAPRAQPAPPAKPAPRTGDKAARAARARARAQAAGITRVTGKTELVQGFFDSVRERDQ
ncbi:flagellar motor switch protein [Limimaricola cinnabarinus]|uniref:flagellar motor switch protein n=1 Tax=Limimaricola cinnabarinus TaxID=1125964 RepID=UPI0024910E15|nr:flagellar motor switch protein [Limimaricola cinnabarinus]